MSRRESVGRLTSRSQSASGPASQEFVSVAVLPPRLQSGMAPPTGIGVADAFSWDEAINWQHNDPIAEKEVSKTKSMFRKAGLTTQRKKNNPDLPPFVLRQIPYDTWRKHYAKDKEGRYRGTHAPAEDCLLKPEDVQKWRLGDAVTKADKWTRGREALPVYAEINETAAVPEYEHDYDGPPRTEPYPGATPGVPDSMTLGPEDDALASHLEQQRSRTMSGDTVPEVQRTNSAISASKSVERTPSSTEAWKVQAVAPSGQIVAKGKTAQQIIEEAKAKEKEKPSGKLGWKQRVKKGAEFAMMGTNV
jgi:hypothetical protein